MLGMEGFDVVDAWEDDGELVVLVETTEPERGCPSCGVIATAPVKERPVVRLRDASSGGRRVRLWWRKRRFVCVEELCERKSFTEQHPGVGARRRSTRRCRQVVATAVARGRSVAEVADEVGMGWRAAMRAVVEEGRAPDPLRPVRRLGVDETVSARGRRFVTHLVDLDDGTVIATVEGRNASVLATALAGFPAWWRDGVAEVAIDPYAPYAAAVRRLLPGAVLVVDKFHVLRLFAAAVDAVRRRTVARAEGRRGRKVDKLWRSRMLLLKRYGNLTAAQEARLVEALRAEDRFDEVGIAWLAYQEALEVFERTGTVGLRAVLADLLALLGDAHVPELTTLATTLDRWMPEIVAYFETGLTNAATEGCNRKVKQVKRVACGFRNADNYILRIALHAGQKHYPPKRRKAKS